MAIVILIVEIIFYLVLCAGVAAQLKKKYHWHDKLQAPVVVLNLLVILFVMIPTFGTVVFGQFPGNLSQAPTLVTAIHGTLGAIAEGLAIYCLLAGFKILPRKIGTLRYFMWGTFVAWTLTLLFGVGVYIVFYTGAAASGETVAEHDAEIAADAPSEATKAEEAPPVEEHAEEVVATEAPAESAAPPTAEAVEEHAEEVVAPEATAAVTATQAVAEVATPTTAPPALVALQGQWQQLPTTGEPPAPRFQHAMQYSPATNQLFVVVGQTGQKTLDDTWALDLNTMSWQFLAGQSPVAPVLFSTVLIVDDAGQNLYLSTGQEAVGKIANKIWRLNLASQIWEDLSASAGQPPEPRYGGPGGKIGNNLILTHGFGTTRYDDTWRFNTSTGLWENITPPGALPIKRCLFAATPSEGNLVINGGCASPDGPCFLDDTWVLDFGANTWREVLSDVKPAGRQHHTLVAAEPGSNQVVLFGGQDANQAALNDLWVLDLTSGAWQQVDAPNGPSARYNHAAVWIPGRGMLVFGGRDSNGALNDLWLLTLGPAAAPDTTAPQAATPTPVPAAPTPVPPTPTPELVSEHDGG